MNFSFHTIAKGGVHHLVTCDWPFSFEGIADDHRFKVMSITLHLNMCAGEAVGDVGLNAFGSDHATDCSPLALGLLISSLTQHAQEYGL